MIDFIFSDTSFQYTGYEIRHQLTSDYVLYCQNVNIIVEEENKKLLVIGDCINCKYFDLKSNGINEIIQKLKGNFYAFLIEGDTLFISNGAFGLLPIFYLNDFKLISSSVQTIKKEAKAKLTENKKWVVNQLLFNYQFANDTYYQEINLFPSFSYLKIKNRKPEFVNFFSIQDEFLKKPTSWKKALPQISEKFIDLVNQYIPASNSIISFTGGFDGRTIVSIATHYKKIFNSFSYGKISNDDVYIPVANAKKLKIPYFWLDLNKEYSNSQYFCSAQNFVASTSGANGLLYAHIDYLTTEVRQRGDILLSGICGSELFRAAHSPGAVTSQILIDLFREDTFNDYRLLVLKSEVLRYIDTTYYQEAIEQVISETWAYKEDLSKSLDKNKALYVFVYGEIFRKFFGPWIKSQMEKIIVRTPYTDFQLFKQIIKTELSGAYSDFLTDNPIKRLKGQVFYAEVIKKTNKKLFWLMTGKGYPPAAVNLPLLRPLLAIPFFTKRIRRKVNRDDFDNLGIISGVKHSAFELSKLEQEGISKVLLLHDLKNLKVTDKETFRDTILNVYSIMLYKKHLHNEK